MYRKTLITFYRHRFHPLDRSPPQPQINKSKEKKLAAISLYICWLFIFCHAWKLIPTAYEVREREREAAHMAKGC